MTERIEALEFRAKRLATAADLLWGCALVLAALVPIIEIIALGRFPIASLVSSAILLLVGWVVREFLFVTVAHAELAAEQAVGLNSSRSAVDSDSTRSTS